MLYAFSLTYGYEPSIEDFINFDYNDKLNHSYCRSVFGFDSESDDSSESSLPGNKNLVFDAIEIMKTNCNQVNFNLIFNFHNSAENIKKKKSIIFVLYMLR